MKRVVRDAKKVVVDRAPCSFVVVERKISKSMGTMRTQLTEHGCGIYRSRLGGEVCPICEGKKLINFLEKVKVNIVTVLLHHPCLIELALDRINTRQKQYRL